MMDVIRKSMYDVAATDDGILTIHRNGTEFFRFPASTKVNGVYSTVYLTSADEQAIVYASEGETITIYLYDDCLRVRCERHFENATAIDTASVFAAPTRGMELIGFDRAFCPQPRNNDGKNIDYYHHLPDISQNGYYTPTIMEISLGSPQGWVCIGLLDLPDSKITRMEEDFSFLLESCGGNKMIPAGGTYTLPEVLIMFPLDEWDAITLFREKLQAFERYTPCKPRFSELPAWWKEPFVCTYGDQMLENIVGQSITAPWVEDIVTHAEQEWGMEHCTLMIDDSWQHFLTIEADESRFPDLRGFIDRLHERGHHVILWHTIAFERIGYAFPSLAEKHHVLSDTVYDGYPCLDRTYNIDYTADGARAYIREMCERLFGNGEGQYHADGIKIDFLGKFRDPATAHYAHPERGMGIKEALLFFEMFYEEAKRVKPDVLINSSSSDPRFEHTLDFNRLHDVHSGNLEKDLRARISTLACPDLPIDSDGALMLNRWLKTNFLNAVIYGVPSNYYTRQYHDGKVHLSKSWKAIEGVPAERCLLLDSEKKMLGALMQMARYRPNGAPVLDDNGNWMLVENGVVQALTRRGETVIFYPTEENNTGYIFTFQDEAIELPLYGRKIGQIDPPPAGDRLIVDYARDRVILKLSVGVVHTFRNIDEGNSIEAVFKQTAAADAVEAEMSYVF